MYEYRQEYFDTFKLKVIQLCHEIGYGEPIQTPKRIAASSKFLAEEESSDIKEQVVILLNLSKYESLKVATVLGYNSTTENAIKSQLVLHSRLPGELMASMYYDLLPDEKLQLATLVAELQANVGIIRLEKPGRLTGGSYLPPCLHGILPLIPSFEVTNSKCTAGVQMKTQSTIKLLVALFEDLNQ
ncbi:hypothetical protein PZA11_004302 [Diplocarpon coronariae]